MTAMGDLGEDQLLVRCPAYLDLYHKSPKHGGKTWTVFCLVRGGRLALRSSKALSKLPMDLVPPSSQYSGRFSPREIKRRRLSAALQLLSAPRHAQMRHSHRHQLTPALRAEARTALGSHWAGTTLSDDEDDCPGERAAASQDQVNEALICSILEGMNSADKAYMASMLPPPQTGAEAEQSRGNTGLARPVAGESAGWAG
ncbi:unnamed protein product, partial [Discosporangium mesarthrocarpum]